MKKTCLLLQPVSATECSRKKYWNEKNKKKPVKPGPFIDIMKPNQVQEAQKAPVGLRLF